MSPSLRNLAVVAGALLLAACGLPLGPCTTERIEVNLPAVIDRAGGRETVTPVAGVAEAKLPSADEYAALRAFLVENAASASSGVLFTLPALDRNPGWFALALRGPRARGETLPLTAVTSAAGWGTFPFAGPPALVSVRAGSYVATAATGSLEVLEVAPLRLRVDVEVHDAAGEAIRLRGNAGFRLVRQSGTCT